MGRGGGARLVATCLPPPPTSTPIPTPTRPPTHFPPSSGSGSDSWEEDEEAARIAALQQQLRDLRPPRPLDLFVQPETSVVVITGPNTGGMTAAQGGG